MSELRPRLRSDLLSQVTKSGLAVYDPVADRTTFVNASARAILELCDGTRTLDQIAERITARFAADPRQVRDDVARAVGEFRRDAFIEPLDRG